MSAYHDDVVAHARVDLAHGALHGALQRLGARDEENAARLREAIGLALDVRQALERRIDAAEDPTQPIAEQIRRQTT